jgi:cyclase
MLKHRIIATLLIRNGVCVQSRGFGGYLPIGRPEIAIAHLNTWGVDEIICLHLDHAGGMDAAYFDHIQAYARRGLVPLAIGGGMGSVEHMRRALFSGADKVVVNTLLHDRPGEIEAAAAIFGRQSLVIAVDVRREGGRYVVYTHGGRRRAALSLKDTLVKAEEYGAGEIMLKSIDRDGARTGYDCDLIAEASGVGVPVIISGGYGTPADMIPALARGASAVAVGNALHHTEHSVCRIKAFLCGAGVPVRHDIPLRYAAGQVDETGRCARLSEEDYLRLRFVDVEQVDI